MSTGNVSTAKPQIPRLWLVWLAAAVLATTLLVCPCGIGVGWLIGGSRGPPASTSSGTASQTKPDKDAIQGEWTAPPGLPATAFTFAGDKFLPWEGRKVDNGGIAVFTLDPAKSPKQIDFKALSDGKTGLGIYELRGDELKLCLANPGKERPSSFDGKLPVLNLKRK